MSAWDLTGAIFWSALAVFFWIPLLGGKLSKDIVFVSFVISVSITAAAVFCISRLAGTHL